MSIQHFSTQFSPRMPLVDTKGIPTIAFGQLFLLQLFQRTGAGNGIIDQVSDSLTATGNNINNALALMTDWNDIETVPAGSGVIIASSLQLKPGNYLWVFNGDAGNALNVYPPDGNGQIDTLGAGAPFSLAAGKLRCFMVWNPKSPITMQFRSYGN